VVLVIKLQLLILEQFLGLLSLLVRVLVMLRPVRLMERQREVLPLMAGLLMLAVPLVLMVQLRERELQLEQMQELMEPQLQFLL